MKTGLLIILSLLIVSGLCAFTQGTINPGGSVSIISYKSDSDASATTTISLTPQVGYFLSDNACLDVLLNVVSQSHGNSTVSSFGLGFGGKYVINKFYAGLGFLMETTSYKNGSYDTDLSENSIYLKAGFLIPVNETVFVDLGAKYYLGVGSYGGDGDGTNEQTQLGLNAGFQIFLPGK